MIETEAENDEALTVVESLLERGEAALKPEALALLDLLGTLIERFEQRAYALQEGDPTGALVILMEGRKPQTGGFGRGSGITGQRFRDPVEEAGDP